MKSFNSVQQIIDEENKKVLKNVLCQLKTTKKISSQNERTKEIIRTMWLSTNIIKTYYNAHADDIFKKSTLKKLKMFSEQDAENKDIWAAFIEEIDPCYYTGFKKIKKIWDFEIVVQVINEEYKKLIKTVKEQLMYSMELTNEDDKFNETVRFIWIYLFIVKNYKIEHVCLLQKFKQFVLSKLQLFLDTDKDDENKLVWIGFIKQLNPYFIYFSINKEQCSKCENISLFDNKCSDCFVKSLA